MNNRMLNSFIALLIFASCTSQHEDLLTLSTNKNDKSSYLVSETQAINNAIAFFNAKCDSSKNKANVKRKTFVNSTSTTTHKQEGVYIINFDNNCGYAVVSADTRDNVSVYLASSEGSFNENDNDNQLLLSAISSYQGRTMAPQSFNPDKGDIEQTITDVVEAEYGPLLNTKWHQHPPFNSKLVEVYPTGDVNHYYMGCVPVAIGQIINYFQYPASVNGENIDWSLISYNQGNNIIPNLATNEISKLLFLIGTDMNINYPSYSGASFSDANKEFHRLGYTFKTKDGYDKNIIKNQVSLGKPIYMRGESSVHSGHAWVADGYMRVRTMYRTYDSDGNLVENTVLNDYNYDNVYEYIHLNIGWQSNPYYASTSFEYSSDIDHRIWVYTDIFNFVQGNPEFSFNKNVKLIYDFSFNS